MERKTCFFIGHRDTPESVRPLLDETVERHIAEYGVTDFVVGHYGRFDDSGGGGTESERVPPCGDAHAASALLPVRPRYRRL